MSFDTALGRHFIIGLQPSPELTEHDKRLLSTLKPAGIALFGRNFRHDADYPDWLASLGKLIGDARDCIGGDRLIVSIDHEGGLVNRPPRPITRFAAAAAWADRAAEVGRAMGVELRSLGVNMDFAPVIDINSNPANPVIGPRAFGPTAEIVIASARAFLAGLEAEGVAGCPKHFPGYGHVTVDPHRDLPELDLSLDDLRERELRPFAALASQARAMMSAHIMLPNIDPEHPATLSHILLGLLREEIGFDGVVITDDIGMPAIWRRYDEAGIATRTLAAGTDLILLCAYFADTGRALGMAAELDASRKAGDLPGLGASADRVDRLLGSLPQHGTAPLSPEVLGRHATLAPLHTSHVVTDAAGTV